MLARRGGGLARRGVTRGSASSPASERRDDDSNIPSRDARASTRASRAFSASARVRDAGRPPPPRPDVRRVRASSTARRACASSTTRTTCARCSCRVSTGPPRWRCARSTPRPRPRSGPPRTRSSRSCACVGGATSRTPRTTPARRSRTTRSRSPSRAVLDARGGGARTRRWLRHIADARVRDAELGMENLTPASVAYLEAYSEATSASLLYTQLDVGGVRDTGADHAASHLGKALGMVSLLRGTPHHAGSRRCYLPLDVCAKHGAVAEDVYRGRSTEAIKDATHEVASVAKAHLDSARGMAETLRETRRARRRRKERPRRAARTR